MFKNTAEYLKNPFVLAAVAVAVLIYGGMLPLRSESPYSSAIGLSDAVEIHGTVSSNPSRFSSGKYYSVSLDAARVSSSKNSASLSSSASGSVSLWIPSSIVEAVYPGKLYSLSGQSVLIEKGERISCRGRWNASYGCFVVSSLDWTGHGGGLSGCLAHFRALCRLVFKRLMYSWADAGGLILSLLSGSREYLGDGVADSFRNSGLSHILALSGMHLSFFAGLSSRAGTSLLGKRWAWLFQALGIIFFIWFAGLSPSLFRAFLCSALSILARGVFCCTADTLEILSAAFLIHVCVRSSDVMSAAFMLSYSSLAGILVFSKTLMRALSRLFPPKLSSSISASIGAQAATAPVSVSLFGSFFPVGIIATVFVSPLVSLFMSLSVAAIIICLMMPFLSGLFGGILNLLYDCIVRIVRLFAMCPPVYV